MPSAACTVESTMRGSGAGSTRPLYPVRLQLRQGIMRPSPIDTPAPEDSERRAPEDVEEEQGGEGEAHAMPAAHSGQGGVEPAEGEKHRDARQVQPARRS